MAKNKAYVVFVGHNPGVYDSWDDASEQVHQYPGAVFKGFTSRAEAVQAFQNDTRPRLGTRPAAKPEGAAPTLAVKRSTIGGSPVHKPLTQVTDAPQGRSAPQRPLKALKSSSFVVQSWAVDAACSGNPGQMEYRGVDNTTNEELFHIGPMLGTNNIGEFLAIVHALAMQQQRGIRIPIYTDSVNAMKWIKAKNARTTLPRTAKTERVWVLIDRATTWLQNNAVTVPILKWPTELWGEIPADFGRKG